MITVHFILGAFQNIHGQRKTAHTIKKIKIKPWNITGVKRVENLFKQHLKAPQGAEGRSRRLTLI